METSAQINELAAALAKAQSEFTGAKKDSDNPFFKSKYPDLASYIEAAKPMHKHGLSVTQMPESTAEGEFLITTLLHASGQWMRGCMKLQPKGDGEQPRGSSLSYVRRYAFAAVTGLPAVDDDAEAASNSKPAYAEPHTPRGELGKNISIDAARAEATAMRGILESDVDEDVKALHVADKHDELNRNSDLYVASADQLSAGERKVWKIYVAAAKKREAAEPRGRTA